MSERKYQVCSHCVMDTSDEYIKFDEKGVCQRCNEYENSVLPWWNHGNGHEDELKATVAKIKESGKGKDYDCIIGISGGLDSSYVLHVAVKEFGLRPFVFHIDAGWDMPETVSNLKKMEKKLGVNIHFEKMNWEEMRQMQIAFFKTGHAGLDVPQDHAFIALVDKYAQKLGVKYILNGGNLATETFTDPDSWFKECGPTGDKTYVKDVLKKHGNVKVKDYPFTTGFMHKFWLPYVKGVKTVKLLNLMPITRKHVIETLQKEYDYVPYGQKHFEDLITKFLEGYWLPKRFGYDIRKIWLSSLVVTGQMTREEALEELKQPPVTEEEGKEIFKEVAKKLEISEAELQSYFDMPRCTTHYKSNQWAFKLGIKLYTILGLDRRIRK